MGFILSAIIWTLIPIIIMSIIMYILKKKVPIAYKIVSWTLLGLFVISAIFSIFLVKDVLELKDNFMSGDKLFLLDHENSIVAGFSQGIEEQPTPVRNIAELNSFYNSKDYDSMLGSNYKLFIFDSSIFDELTAVEPFENFRLTKDESFSILMSENPVDLVADKIMEQEGHPAEFKSQILQQISEQFGSPEDLKSMLFGGMFISIMEIKGPQFIVTEFKDKNINIYPETLTFKFLRLVPKKTFENIMSQVVQSSGIEKEVE